MRRGGVRARDVRGVVETVGTKDQWSVRGDVKAIDTKHVEDGGDVLSMQVFFGRSASAEGEGEEGEQEKDMESRRRHDGRQLHQRFCEGCGCFDGVESSHRGRLVEERESKLLLWSDRGREENIPWRLQRRDQSTSWEPQALSFSLSGWPEQDSEKATRAPEAGRTIQHTIALRLPLRPGKRLVVVVCDGNRQDEVDDKRDGKYQDCILKELVLCVCSRLVSS